MKTGAIQELQNVVPNTVVRDFVDRYCAAGYRTLDLADSGQATAQVASAFDSLDPPPAFPAHSQADARLPQGAFRSVEIDAAERSASRLVLEQSRGLRTCKKLARKRFVEKQFQFDFAHAAVLCRRI